MSPAFRPYQPHDREACLAVFRSNVPRYFAPHEEAEFAEFLDELPCTYFVLEAAGEVLGCGGYYVAPGRGEGGLCWGMVHRRHHGGGLGRRLLLERLYRLVQHPEVAFIRLDTSQHTCGFFEKLGFATIKTESNGYAPGLDRYDMQLWLEPAARARIMAAWLEAQALQGEPS